jgi:hypothetical protein
MVVRVGEHHRPGNNEIFLVDPSLPHFLPIISLVMVSQDDNGVDVTVCALLLLSS